MDPVWSESGPVCFSIVSSAGRFIWIIERILGSDWISKKSFFPFY